MALNVFPSESSGVAYAYRVRPENVLAIRTEGLQTQGCVLDCGAPTRIRRIGQYADKRILSKRTCRPSSASNLFEPGMSRLVIQVSGIKESNQDVHVEEGYHTQFKVRRGAG